MAVEIIDHVVQGKGRLLDIFKDKPNILKLLEVYLGSNQSIEDLYQSLSRPYDLDSDSAGILDNIGSIVGEGRLGRGNEEYKRALLFRVGVNTSDCSREHLLTILKDYTESSEVTAHNHNMKSVLYSYNGDTPNNSDLLSDMSMSSPLATNIAVLHNKNSKGFTPCEVGDTSVAAVLPEIGDTTGYLPMEIKQENINVEVDTSIGYSLKDHFSISSYIGNGVGRDIITPVDTTGGVGYIIALVYINSSNTRTTANYGSSAAYQGLFNSFNTSTNNIISYNNNGISVGNNADFNGNTLSYSTMIVTPDTLNRFCRKFTYVGDGNYKQRILHGLSNTPCKLWVRSTSSIANQPTIWVKGMPSSKHYYINTIKENRYTWGGEEPTLDYFTVGNTEVVRADNLNEDGVTYEVICFADNEDFGVTAGSYTGSGTVGQIITKDLPTGLLMIFSESGLTTYNTKSGTLGFVSKNTAPTTTSSALLSIGDSGNFQLGSSNVYTNTAGKEYYWFCIANPEVYNI